MKRYSSFFIGLLLLSTSTVYSAEITIRVPEGNGYAPFFIRELGGKWGGLSIELVEALLEEAGHTPKYVRMPFNRGLQSMQDGTIDMMLNLTITGERGKTIHFIGPQLDETVHMVVRKDADFSFNSLDDFKALPRPVGIEIGKVYSKSFETKRATDASFRNILEEVNEVRLNERKLGVGRISGFLGYGYNIFYQIKTNPHYKYFKVHPFIINQDQVYFGFSKKNFPEQWLRVFQEAYDRATRKKVFDTIKGSYREK